VLLIVALAATAALLPASGQSRPPESDGSSYTWTGAATLSVDVKPWGGGYVRSDPYLIDCPLACIRPFDQNREITLTAYVTIGHTFAGWEGACAGQGNPCTLKVSGAMVETAAVFTGQYTPPAPPAAPVTPPPPGVNPTLTNTFTFGNCGASCFTVGLSGTGYNPNSSIDVTVDYATPDSGPGTVSDVATGDAAGAWSTSFTGGCGTYTGPVVIDVTATDALGASASTQVSGSCPAAP
jgi:hypothetical protein